MSSKKLPGTDEGRVDILRVALEQEETNEAWDKILSITEVQELRLFIITFESAESMWKQVINDTNKAKNIYSELFKNVQVYISHFIQVLILTVIRNEIKSESLALYGLQDNNPVLPDLSTEEAVLKWGKNLISGEAERIYRGGIPLYNPAIAKVKVHYELFEESIHSLAIYKKNLVRLQSNMQNVRKKADDLIWKIWTKVEERYSHASLDEQHLRYQAYKMQFLHRRGEQLNVFD